MHSGVRSGINTETTDNEIGAGYAYRRDVEALPENFLERSRELGEKILKNQEWRNWAILLGIMFLGLLTLLLISTIRCRDDSPGAPLMLIPEKITIGGETFEGRRFLGLESTRKTQNPTLVAELQAILKSNEAPNDLSAESVVDSFNMEKILENCFTRMSDKDYGDLQLLAQESSIGAWSIPPATLRQTAPILQRLEADRHTIRTALENKATEFTFDVVQFEGSGDAPPSSDWLLNYVRMEEFSLAQSLERGATAEATSSLRFIFRAAQKTSKAKSVALRYTAAKIRQKGVNILQSLVLRPEFTSVFRREIEQELLAALADWPADRTAWIGERANGMLVFETIRKMGLENVLSEAELEELDHRKIYDKVNNNLLTSLDPDEAFYLKTMAALIASCDEPFYRRGAFCDELEQTLREKFGADDEPYISMFLLRGVRGMMQSQAADRALVETCCLALATAEGRKLPRITVDPVFGNPYVVQEAGNAVSVGFSPEARPFIVLKSVETTDSPPTVP